MATRVSHNIQTKRLNVCIPDTSYAQEHFAAVTESIENLRQWPASLSWTSRNPSLNSSLFFLETARERFLEGVDFAFILKLKESGEIVGGTGLHQPNWSVPKFEIGWWGRTSFLGKGLVTEGVSALLKYSLLELRANRVFALPEESNTRSKMLCERLGMRLEGVLMNDRATPSGQLVNTCVYALVPSIAIRRKHIFLKCPETGDLS